MTAEGMPRPGAILDGKYRLVRQLGAGGMGVVYEADHVRLRQPYAIKILLPELAAESEFLRRFDREARAAALLHGPHIVRVFDVDTTADNLTYMVMELLDGQDLAAEALDGPLSLPQLVSWIIQVCSGLQDAHDAGIVHRDLKPANIFLATNANGERVAKILDFGISKHGATTALSVRTVGPPAALGTPMFMAPEQIRGRQIDARTDVWALGIVLYNLLTSRWPFAGNGDQKYMTAVLADAPVPFEPLRPDLPYEFGAVVMKALEKDPANRYASTAEMAAALAPFGLGRIALDTVEDRRGPNPTEVTPPTIVVPVAAASRNDRGGANDTIIHTPRNPVRERYPAAEQAPGHLAAWQPAISFVPPKPLDTRVPRRSGAAVIVTAVAVCGALAIGALAYRSGVGRVTTGSSPDAPAGNSASAPAAEPLPPAIELPWPASATSAAPASSAPPASADPKPPHRRRAPHPANAGSSARPEAQSPPPANPTLL